MKRCVFENIWVCVTSLCLSHLEQRWIGHLISAGCQRHQNCGGFSMMSWVRKCLAAGLKTHSPVCWGWTTVHGNQQHGADDGFFGSVIFRNMTFFRQKGPSLKSLPSCEALIIIRKSDLHQLITFVAKMQTTTFRGNSSLVGNSQWDHRSPCCVSVIKNTVLLAYKSRLRHLTGSFFFFFSQTPAGPN